MDHGVVHVGPERLLNGLQVGLVAVRGQLHTVPQAALEVGDDHERVGGGALSHQPRRHQLRVADLGQRPDVAVAEGVAVFLGDVLLVGVAQRADFVTLDTDAWQVGELAVLVLRARLGQVGQQLGDGVFAAPPTVARMLIPSTRQPTICARCSVLNLFTILTIMLDRLGISRSA